MRTWRWYSKVLLGLLILAFAYYVWPTPWQCFYDGHFLVRTHRLYSGHSLKQGMV